MTWGFLGHDLAAQDGDAVSIVDFDFSPATLEVPAGTPVAWANHGQTMLTVTADNSAFGSGELAPAPYSGRPSRHPESSRITAGLTPR